MTTYDACAIIEGFDGQPHTEEEVTAAFQSLIDSGVVWTLQGFYGRQATDCIRRGLCTDSRRSPGTSPRGGGHMGILAAAVYDGDDLY